MSGFYAYIHARQDGSVFYVGKGRGRRSHTMRGRSDHHQKVINKVGASNVLVGKLECSSEAIAFGLEKGLIKCFRRMGVALVNKTDGGDGTSGFRHSAETKKFLSELFNNTEHAENHRASVKVAHIRSKEKYCSSAKESQNRPEVVEKHKAYQGSVRVRADKSVWSKSFWSDTERSSETRRKINESSKREDVIALKSSSMKGKNKGKISVMRGKEHRMIQPEELEHYLFIGWEKGNPSSKGRQTAKGRKWVNNGNVNKMVFPGELTELLLCGWRRGRI